MAAKSSANMFWWGGMVVLCLLLNCGVAEDRSVADLLIKLRDANSEKEANAILFSHVLGISIQEFYDRLINDRDALINQSNPKVPVFLSQVEEEEYDEIGKLVGQEELFKDQKLKSQKPPKESTSESHNTLTTSSVKDDIEGREVSSEIDDSEEKEAVDAGSMIKQNLLYFIKYLYLWVH